MLNHLYIPRGNPPINNVRRGSRVSRQRRRSGGGTVDESITSAGERLLFCLENFSIFAQSAAALLRQQIRIKLPSLRGFMIFLQRRAGRRDFQEYTKDSAFASCSHSFVSENVLGPTFETAERAEDIILSSFPASKLMLLFLFSASYVFKKELSREFKMWLQSLPVNPLDCEKMGDTSSSSLGGHVATVHLSAAKATNVRRSSSQKCSMSKSVSTAVTGRAKESFSTCSYLFIIGDNPSMPPPN